MNDKNTKFEETLDEFMNNFSKNEINVPDELESRIVERIRVCNTNKSCGKKILIGFLITVLVFVGGVRFNENFAAYASKIEILKSIVDLIKYKDKGIQNAFQNGYKKMNGIILEQDGFTLNIDDIFVDEDRINMTIKITGDKVNKMKLSIYDLYIIPEFRSNDYYYKGSVLKNDVDYDNNTSIKEVEFSFNESYEFENIINKNNVAFKLDLYSYDNKLKERKLLQEFNDIKIPIQEENIKKSKIYPQNSVIDFEYGKIYFSNFVIGPTRMKIDYYVEMKNDFSFEGFQRFFIKDNRGNVYKPDGLITLTASVNGNIITGSNYFVPSTYFNENNVDLTLYIEGLRYMRLDEKTVVLNKNDSYPKVINYMGEVVTFYKPTKNKDGDLIISYDVAAINNIYDHLRIRNQNLKYKLIDKTAEIIEDKDLIHVKYICEIDDDEVNDNYKFYIDSNNDYIYEKNIEIKLDTDS